MGFLDKAKKMAEQAQAKLDEAQTKFNENQGHGSAPSGPTVEYDAHGRPIAPSPGEVGGEVSTPPHGDPLGSATPSSPGSAPVNVDAPTPPAPPAPPVTAPDGPPAGAAAPSVEAPPAGPQDPGPAPPPQPAAAAAPPPPPPAPAASGGDAPKDDPNSPSYDPPKLSSGDPLAG
jgi:hypothetical protein